MKNMIRIVPVSALRDNYIWALCNATHCALIDPGASSPAQEFLAREQLSLASILLTHHHADHQAGVSALVQDCPVPVFGPECNAMPAVTHTLSNEQKFNLPGLDLELTAIAVPGHTKEHFAYIWEDALFCGDTLFSAGCGRLLGGTASELHKSLSTLAKLPGHTRIFCAHEYTLNNLRFALAVEPSNQALQKRQAECVQLRANNQATLPSLLHTELSTNPFLRCQETKVIQAAEKHAGHALHDPLEVFSVLRRWKDDF